jgi:sugar-specific transcriptional regulator TrmB
MEIKHVLENIGLSSLEAQVYLSLVTHGRMSVSLLSQDTGIYRPTIYRILPMLVENGLVSCIIVKKRKLYLAEDPSRLSKLITNKKNDLEAVLPDLSRMFGSIQTKPVISFYEGKKSIQHIYETMTDRLKKGEAFYRYESPRDHKILRNYYPELYRKRTGGLDGEIEKFVITNEVTEKDRLKRLTRHTRYIPGDIDAFDYNISQVIYKDTVMFIDYDTETATVIQNKRFADLQLRLFKILFSKLPRT